MPHNNFRLDAENMELRMELGQLRGRPDPHDVETEIQRRGANDFYLHIMGAGSLKFTPSSSGSVSEARGLALAMYPVTI